MQRLIISRYQKICPRVKRHGEFTRAITLDVLTINAQMKRVYIFGMLHPVQVIISKFDALFKFTCLARTLAQTSLWAAH